MCAYENAGETIEKMSRSTVLSLSPEFIVVTPQTSDGTPLMIKTLASCIEGVLPVSKGGTGLSEIEGSKLIASSADGVSLEEVDVPVRHLAGLKENIQEKLDTIRSYSVTITVQDSLWVTETIAGTTRYYRDFSVVGMRATDNPLVGLKSTATTKEEIDSESYAYGCIDLVLTDTDTVKIYCYEEIPPTEISLWFTCI